MARLTKLQASSHEQACELVALRRDLTEEERAFVLEHYQEAATASHGLAGAFFTPGTLANDMSLHVQCDRMIDLCAGIGTLAYHCTAKWSRRWQNLPPREIVCIERNPEYVKVGRKVLPEATWIEGDIFDLPDGLGHFDTAISNPPFGAVKRTGNGGSYTGRRFEYHVIEIASCLADDGVFIIPQTSATFRYSGRSGWTEERDAECRRFEELTGIRIEANCGIDTAYARDQWHGVAPMVEIVLCDFDPAHREQVDSEREFAATLV